MSKSNSTDAGIVSHIVYRVPKKNRDAMLRICNEAYDMFKQYGILHDDAFSLAIQMYQWKDLPILQVWFLLTKMRKFGLSQFITEIANT